MTRTGQEQLAFWMPSGTKARIRQLAREGESLAMILLRGISALEGIPTGEARRDGAILASLERIEAHLNLSSQLPGQEAVEAVRVALSLSSQPPGQEATEEAMGAEIEAPDLSSHVSSQPGDTFDRERSRTYARQLQAEGLGFVAIAECLTAEGWPTAKGGPWRESSIRGLLKK